MDFSTPERRPRETSLLPMINVVFLLLVFFLIAAKLAPPEPFAVTPPEASAQDETAGDFTLYLGADGQLGFDGAQSADAATDAGIFDALTAARLDYCARADCTVQPPRLMLRADAAAPVARLAALLPALGTAGFAQVDLVTRASGDAT